MKARYKVILSGILATLALLMLAWKVFYPHHRTLAVVFYLLGWGPLLWAGFQKWNQLKITRTKWILKLKAWLPYLIVAKLLLTFAYVSGVLAPIEDTALISLSNEELENMIQTDSQIIKRHEVKMDWLIRTIMANKNYLDDPQFWKTHQRDLQNLGFEYVTSMVELDQIKNRYQGFHQLDYNTRPAAHADAFFTAFTAFAVQYKYTLRLTRFFPEQNLQYFESSDESLQMTRDTYQEMKIWLTSTDALLRLNAGTAYLKVIRKGLSLEDSVVANQEIRVRDIYKMLGRNPEIFIDNPLDIIEEKVTASWLPVHQNMIRFLDWMKEAELMIFPRDSVDFIFHNSSE